MTVDELNRCVAELIVQQRKKTCGENLAQLNIHGDFNAPHIERV